MTTQDNYANIRRALAELDEAQQGEPWGELRDIVELRVRNRCPPDAIRALLDERDADAARLDFLCSTGRVRMAEGCKDGWWRVYEDAAPPDAPYANWTALTIRAFQTPREAIDAAIAASGDAR